MENSNTLEVSAPQASGSTKQVVAESAPPKSAARKSLGVPAWLSLVWLVAIAVIGVLTKFTSLGLPDPEISDVNIAGAGPSLAHPFGGDRIARDVFSRVVHGTGNTLIIAVGGILIGLIVGGLLGLIAGYFGGWIDKILSSLFDILLAFPAEVLALAMVSVFAGEPDTTPQTRLLVLVLSLGTVSIPLLARITRANTLAWADREFVLAAKAMGSQWHRILFRDVLPNVVPAMMSIAFLGVGLGVVVEAGLSVLGLGVQLPESSWGNVLAEHASQLRSYPWAIFGPVIFIFLTVLSLNTLGDAIQKRFDVRESLL